MKKNVLSLFDGMSCCQIALKSLGIKVDKYYASEIEYGAIRVARHNFPKMEHIGDVRNIESKDLPKIWLLAAGSPCTDLSIAGGRKGMLGITSLDDYLKLKKKKHNFGKSQSYLFYEFLRVLRELKPKYFLLENVVLKGKMKKYEKIITDSLGVEPIRINSSLVSAQNRDRLYWTNIPGITIPKDKGILCTDVIPNGYGAGRRGVKKKSTDSKYEIRLTIRTDMKFNCLVTNPTNTNLVYHTDGTVRKVTVQEAEVLQTLPKGYTNVEGVTQAEKYRMIGNGWTIDVIKHLLKPLKSQKVLEYSK
jgi:site-specific DNA-cytosine methylase